MQCAIGSEHCLQINLGLDLLRSGSATKSDVCPQVNFGLDLLRSGSASKSDKHSNTPRATYEDDDGSSVLSSTPSLHAVADVLGNLPDSGPTFRRTSSLAGVLQGDLREVPAFSCAPQAYVADCQLDMMLVEWGICLAVDCSTEDTHMSP